MRSDGRIMQPALDRRPQECASGLVDATDQDCSPPARPRWKWAQQCRFSVRERHDLSPSRLLPLGPRCGLDKTIRWRLRRLRVSTFQNIDDTGMRASREYDQPFPRDIGRQKMFVHDQWIGFPVFAVDGPAIMARESTLKGATHRLLPPCCALATIFHAAKKAPH